MKKISAILTIILTISIVAGTIPVLSAETTTTLENVEMGGLRIYINGDGLLPTDVNGRRVESFIYNGTTYLPVRAIGEGFNCHVWWDDETSTVTINRIQTDAKRNGGASFIDDVEATNKETVTLENVVNSGITIIIDGKKLEPTDANGNPVEPLIYNGTTYVPVRAVAGGFGEPVNWDAENYAVWLGARPARGSNRTDASLKRLYDKLGNKYVEVIDNRYGKSLHWVYTALGGYTKFKGTIYVPQGSETDGEAYVVVAADGVILFDSGILTKDSKPIDFEVDVTGRHYPNITFSASAGNSLPLCAGNVELIR